MGETSAAGGPRAGKNSAGRLLEEAAAQAAAEPGDQTALDELFSGLYEPVLRYVQARVYEPATAEDLTQDVFVKLVQAVGRYSGGGIYGYVFAIARNVITDHYRRLRNRGYETPTGEVWQLDMPSADMGPEEVAEWSELRQAINRLLNQLPASQQEVLRLKLVAGLSTAEMAEVLAKPVGTIRVMQCRALAKLRKLMPDGTSTMATYLLSASDGRKRAELLTDAAQLRVRESSHAGSARG